MKNLLKLLFASLFIVNFSCHDSENVIDGVLDYETGAILRTISIDNAVLNSSDANSAFVATVEEQDEADGGLLQEIRVNAMFRDFSPEDGTTEAEAFVYSIPASETTVGPVGLPRATINMTFGAAVGAMGLTSADYNPGDVIVVKLEVVLTDGRVYGADSAAGIITGGFFSSPFQYNALLTCSPMPGDYTVVMFDSYGDGWQTTTGGDGGQGLEIDMDGVVTSVAMCSQWGTFDFECTPTSDGYNAVATVTIPAGTQSATWTWPGDYYGEIGLEILAPDGSVAFSALDPGTVPVGLLPVAVCAE